jgi:ferredoxin
MTPFIDYALCVGCGACAELYPLLFQMREDQAWVIYHEKYSLDEHERIVNSCPFDAMSFQ